MAKLEKRRDSDGQIRFTFRYIDIDGTRKRHTPDVETEPEALRIQAEVLARIARGIVGVPDVRSAERQQHGPTLADLHERYQAEAMPKKAKNPHEYKKQIRSGVQKLLPVFGELTGTMKAIKIDRLTILGSGMSGPNASLGAQVVSVNEQIRASTGVDLVSSVQRAVLRSAQPSPNHPPTPPTKQS